MVLSSEISCLLKEHPSLELVDDNKRVQCSLSKHEMPLRFEVIKTYIDGKKYKRYREKADLEFNEYKQHLVPSTKPQRKHQLYCNLTGRHCNGNTEHIFRHVNGRRFNKALIRFKECEKSGEKFMARPQNSTQNVDPDNAPDYDTEDEGDNLDDNDDLQDLYPAKYYENESTNNDTKSDIDENKETSQITTQDDSFEELSEEEIENKSIVTKIQKRKCNQEDGPCKILKKEKLIDKITSLSNKKLKQTKKK